MLMNSFQASYFSTRPTIGPTGGAVNPFQTSPPTSPTSPTSPTPYNHRRRTTSHGQSKSHSRSQSHSAQAVQEDQSGPLPRVKSNQSITSITTASSHHRAHRSREPPSPTSTAYSIAGPSMGRNLPRGMSMTSLSQQGFGAMQNPSSMYGQGGPSNGHLNRTSSQPYVNRWFSTSPGAGSSAFGSPAGNGVGHYYAHPGADRYAPVPVGQMKPKESKITGPTYPVLNLPSGTRKKKVLVILRVLELHILTCVDV